MCIEIFSIFFLAGRVCAVCRVHCAGCTVCLCRRIRISRWRRSTLKIPCLVVVMKLYTIFRFCRLSVFCFFFVFCKMIACILLSLTHWYCRWYKKRTYLMRCHHYPQTGHISGSLHFWANVCVASLMSFRLFVCWHFNRPLCICVCVCVSYVLCLSFARIQIQFSRQFPRVIAANWTNWTRKRKHFDTETRR